LSEVKPGCDRPVIKRTKVNAESSTVNLEVKKEEQVMVKVGKPAPTFEAPAFHKGQFINVNLEDYKGKWLLVCFYPGDFTFV